MEQNLNKYVKKAHINAIAKFNAELAEFAKYTGEYPPTLYEDIFTPFTLWNIRLENGILYWDCDRKTEWSKVVLFD